MFVRLTIAFLFLIIFNLSAQDEEKKYESERITRQKNHIKEVLSYRFKLGKNDSSLVEHNFYDSTGNLTERRQYDDAGRLQYRSTLAYNDKGLMTQETGYDGGGSLLQKFVYMYDKHGHRIDYKQLNATGKILTHQKSIFNSKGQRVKLLNRLRDGDDFYLSATFSYGKEGFQISSKMYSPYGDVGSISEYEYDVDRNLIATYNIVDREKKLYYTNKYNAKKQLAETKFYQMHRSFTDGKFDASDTDQSVKFTYDAEGNIVEETTWIKNSVIKRIKYQYKKDIP